MNIVIHNADNTELMSAPITAAAIHEEVLMDKDSITLEYNVAASSPTSILAGSYIEWEGIRYYMADDYRPESKEAGVFLYRPEFIHEVYMLRKMPFLLINAANEGNSVESDWNYTGSLQDLANTLANAINDALYLPAEAQYTIDVDESIENALSLSFANVSILDALNSICEELECEWYTDEAIYGSAGGKIIHIAPTCVHGTTPLRLTAGVEVGLPSSNAKHEFFNRFYVFGSTRNIPQTYQGAQANAVVNKRLTLDPELHPDGSLLLPRYDVNGNIMTELPPEELEDDMNVDEVFGSIPFYTNEAGNVEHYIPDPSTNTRLFTKVLHFDDVYPCANLHVGAVYKQLEYVLENNKKVEIGTDSNGQPIYSTYYVYYLTLLNEENQPFTIDPTLYDAAKNPQGNRLAGLDFSVHFKSGALTGREFVVDYNENAVTRKHADGSGTVNVAAHSFMVKFTQDGTIVIPNSNIEPAVGDEVIVFNCRMPDEYIRSAYKKLEVEALKAIYEDCRDSNEYEVASNKIYFHEHPLSIHIGRHVKFTAWGRVIDTRVTKLTTNLDCSYEQKIAFSKGLRKGTISTILTTIESTANRVLQVQQEDSTQLKIAKKQLYAAQQEAIDAMFDPEGYFTEPIRPSTIQTQIIQIGAKSTNFVLSNVVIVPNLKNGAKDPNYVSVRSTNGKLTHYGISEEGVVEWNVRDSSAPLSAGVYYIYARCTRTGSAMTCDIVFDQQQRQFNGDNTNYYFLCGTISSVQGSGSDAMRVVSLTYGSSMISGNNIQTGIIRSINGNTEINLETGEIKGDFSFSATSKTRVNEIINANTTVAQASNDASTAKTNASTALSTASAAQSSAQQAVSDASSAKANAQQALLAANNLSVGGRNLVLGTRTPLNMTYPTSNYNQVWLKVSDVIRIGSPSEDFYVTASYKVDNWTESFPPIHTIVLGKSNGTSGNFGTDSWSRRILFASGSYKQLTATTRLYTATQIVKTGDTNIGLIANSFGFLTNSNVTPSSAIRFSAYEIMVEKGNTPTDWSPAPEDVEEAANNAEQHAQAALGELANYASDSKISPSEKESLSQQWTEIKQEKAQIDADATRYAKTSDSSYTAYVTAYNNVSTAMSYFLSKTSPTWASHIDISSGTGATYYGYISTYFAKRTDVLKMLAAAAKSATDTAQSAATKAQLIAKAAPNLWFDRYFQNTSYWSIGSSYTSSAYTPPTGGNMRLLNSRDHRAVNYAIPLVKGHSYQISCWALKIAGSQRLNLSLWYQGQSSGNSWTGYNSVAPTVDATSGSWQHISRIITPDSYVVNAQSAEIYFQIEQASSGGATQWIIADLVVLDYTANKAAQSLEYLKASLAEAASGTTDITGGLVLSNFIGVKENESSSFIVAGLNGTTASGENALPMIFAGRSNSNPNGTFRVWNDGVVESVSKNTLQKLLFDNSSLVFYKWNSSTSRYDTLNVVEAKDASTIDAMVSDAGALGSSGTYAKKSKTGLANLAARSFQNYMMMGNDIVSDPVKSFSGTASQSVLSDTTTLFTATKVGSLHIAAGSLTLYASTSWSQSPTAAVWDDRTGAAHDYSPAGNTGSVTKSHIAAFTYTLKVCGKTILNANKSITGDSLTIDWEAQDISFAADTVVKVELTVKGQISVQVNMPDLLYLGEGEWLDEGVSKYQDCYSYIYGSVQGALGATLTAFAWSYGQEAYCNHFYANGLLLAEGAYNYIGLLPKGDPLLKIMAKQYHGMQITKTNGVQICAGSSNWWALNPLCLILRITWDNSKANYTSNAIYNPRNVTPNVAKDSSNASNCKIFHKLSTSSIAVNVIVRNSSTADGRRAGVQVYIGSDFVTINAGDYNNTWRVDFDVFFYDCRMS